MEVKRRRRDDDEPWSKMTSSTGITGKLLGWYGINMINFWRDCRGKITAIVEKNCVICILI